MSKKNNLRKFSIGILIFIYFPTAIFSFQQSHSKKRSKIIKETIKNYPIPKYARELEKSFSFPAESLAEQNVYLKHPMFMCKDLSDNIYLTDFDLNFVLKFSEKGNYLKTISRTGQGPGELLRPLFIGNYKEDLIIYDSGNSRFQIIDQEGRYIDSFKTFKTYNHFSVDSGGYLITAPNHREEHLIEVLDLKGKLIRKFGKKIKIKNRKPEFNSSHISLKSNGEVCVAWKFFPIVQIFSKEGTLLSEIKIHHKKMQELEKLNIKESQIIKKNTTSLRILINGIYSAKNSFYIIFNGPRFEILEYDYNGKQIGFYWVISEEFQITSPDFLVIEDNSNNKLFYIIQRYPNAIIDVYKIKKGK